MQGIAEVPMSEEDVRVSRPRIKAASRSALWLGILTFSAMFTGIFLIVALGGTSGRDLGASASGAALKDAAPSLITAEFLKVGLGSCQALIVRSVGGVQARWHAGALLTGFAAAGLLAASGVVGIGAVVGESRGLGAWASALGFASVGVTALWVAIFIGSATFYLPRWLQIVGTAFAIAAVLSVLIAPVAMLTGIIGIAWWIGLSRALANISIKPDRII